MLSGRGNEDGKKIIKSDSPKKHFWYISLWLFFTTTMPLFCTIKRWHVLVTHCFFYEGNCRDVLTRNFVVCTPVCFYFLTAAHFHLAGRFLLAASIFHFLTTTIKFCCFSSPEIRLICFKSLAIAFSRLST